MGVVMLGWVRQGWDGDCGARMGTVALTVQGQRLWCQDGDGGAGMGMVAPGRGIVVLGWASWYQDRDQGARMGTAVLGMHANGDCGTRRRTVMLG